jgi:hypothetical protein
MYFMNLVLTCLFLQAHVRTVLGRDMHSEDSEEQQQGDTHKHDLDTSQEPNKADGVPSHQPNKADGVAWQEAHSPREMSETSISVDGMEPLTPASSQKPADQADDVLPMHATTPSPGHMTALLDQPDDAMPMQSTMHATLSSQRQLVDQRSPRHDDDDDEDEGSLPAAAAGPVAAARKADIAAISDAILAGIFTELAQDFAKQGVLCGS